VVTGDGSADEGISTHEVAQASLTRLDRQH
jgi:hypothetical protein